MSDTPNAADQPLLVHTADGVCTLTLNRPAALNSFTAAMHALLLPALEAAAADPAVKVVVITGADGAPPDVADVVARLYRPLANRVRSMPVPVIAAVNGVAAGAGANLALCCDFVIAARSASFIQAFSKIGLIPDCGGTWLLPRLVGRARAIGLAMTGDKLPAQEAAAMGMIWRCVDDAELAAEVRALAAKLATLPSRALAETRRVIDAATTLGFDDALVQEAQVQGVLGAAHDFAEGTAAFRAKRAPVFKDR